MTFQSENHNLEYEKQTCSTPKNIIYICTAFSSRKSQHNNLIGNGNFFFATFL